jgi:hypothetical protein
MYIYDVKIVEKIDCNRIRIMCIDHKYYTSGSNEDYLEMLNKFHGKTPTAKRLQWIAENIYTYSNTYDNVLDIMQNLLEEGISRIVVG